MIKHSIKKHWLVKPENIVWATPGVYTTIGYDMTTITTGTTNVIIGNDIITSDTFTMGYTYGNRMTYIDNYDHGYETVTISRETTMEHLYGSGMGIADVKERIKHDMVYELATKLIQDDLVEIEERDNDYGRNHSTIMKLKVKRNN